MKLHGQQAGAQAAPAGGFDPDLSTEAQNEHSPLLPKSLPCASVLEITQGDEPEEALAVAAAAAAADQPPRSRNGGRHIQILLVLCALALVDDISVSLLDRPTFALVQLTICRDHYRTRDSGVIGPPPGALVDEALCRVDEVQVAVANLRAQWTVIERVVQILLLLPYGSLVDVIGRRSILFLNVAGSLCATLWTLSVCYFHNTFSSRLLLASPFFLLIGGGGETASAVLCGAIADLVPANKRTAVFYLLSTIGIAANLVAVPFGSWLMTRDIWLPFKISIPVGLLMFPLLLFLPKIHGRKPSTNIGPADEDAATPRAKISRYGSVAEMYVAMRNQARAILVAIQSLGSLLVVVFIAALATSCSVIFIQFAEKITGSVANTGYVQTIATLTRLVVFVMSTLLSARASDGVSHKTTSRRNGWILTIGLAVCSVGMLTIGLSQSVVTLIPALMIRSAGSFYAGALSGIVASLAGEVASATKLFTANSLAAQVATISGTFLFTKLYELGLGMHSRLGSALPYVVASALFVISAILAVGTTRPARPNGISMAGPV